MEQRKIWRAGKFSYVTVVPKEWAERVKEGKVIVTQTKYGLVLTPSEIYEHGRLRMQVKVCDPLELRNDIIGAYLNHHDEIEVVFDKPWPKCIEELHRLQTKLIGLRVGPPSGNTFLVSISTDPVPVSQLLDIMFDQYSAMYEHNSAILGRLPISTDESDQTASIIEASEDAIDGYSLLMKRLFNRLLMMPWIAPQMGIEDITDLEQYSTINANIERLGDLQCEILEELCRLSEERGEQARKDIGLAGDPFVLKEYYDHSHQLVKQAYSGKNDRQKLMAIIKTKHQEEGGIEKSVRSLAKTSSLVCLFYKIHGMRGNATNIAEAWLDMQEPPFQ